jgi:hypothetical protein
MKLLRIVLAFVIMALLPAFSVCGAIIFGAQRSLAADIVRERDQPSWREPLEEGFSIARWTHWPSEWRALERGRDPVAERPRGAAARLSGI